MDTQVCRQCGATKPLTAAHWPRSAGFARTATGFQVVCKACKGGELVAVHTATVREPAAARRAASQAAKNPGRVASGKAHAHPNPAMGTVYVGKQPKKLPARGLSLADALRDVIQPNLVPLLEQAQTLALEGDREMLKIVMNLYAANEPQAPGALADIYYELARRREEGLSRRRALLGAAGVPAAEPPGDAGAGVADSGLPDALVAGGGAVSPGAG